MCQLKKASLNKNEFCCCDTRVNMCCFQLNDEPHIADALVTKGVAYGGAVPEQIKVRHVCIVCLPVQ